MDYSGGSGEYELEVGMREKLPVRTVRRLCYYSLHEGF